MIRSQKLATDFGEKMSSDDGDLAFSTSNQDEESKKCNSFEEGF
jgi:hypothetical protein